MRTALRCVAVLLSSALSLLAQPSSDSTTEAHDLFRQVSAKLQSLTSVSYRYRRQLNYTSENYQNVLEGEVSIFFDATQLPVGALYQARDASGFEIFNGSEILRGNTTSHSLTMSAVHAASDLDRLSYLYNSFLTLRLALPKFLADPTIGKSIRSQDHDVYKLALRIPRAVLNASGTLSPITLPRDILYQITVDTHTLLPIEVLQSNSQNSDTTLVQFSQLDTNPEKPAPDSWRYSSYADYRLVVPGAARTPLTANNPAPEWSLPLVNANGKTTSLTQILADGKTKLLLLEFWISHCGYSIDAVPKLNSLANRFKPAGLEVAALNPDDTESTIQLFVKNYNPQFALLTSAGKVAEQYGVPGYPTVFLIDRQGKILYSGAFDHDVLATRIASLLPEIP